MNKKEKTQRGITLIALVITIIVMLILVAVTISMAVNGGLFDYAGKAVGDTNNAVKAEQQLGNGGVTVNGTYYNTIDEYLNPDEDTTEETLVSLYKAGELKIGDYVDYNPAGATTVNPDNPENVEDIAVGALTGYTTEAQSVAYEDLSWRVLGYDETNDKLLLISAETTTGVLKFHGYIGYNNFVNVLETVCSKLYSNTNIGAIARSITMADIDTYLEGSSFDKTTYGGGSETSIGYGYRNQAVSSRYQINEETGDLELVANEGTVTLDLTCTAYEFDATKVITDATKLDLLQGSNTSSTDYYWVASRSVKVSSGLTVWCGSKVRGPKVLVDSWLVLSDETSVDDRNLLRPVVSLSSNITTEQVPVLKSAPASM